MTICSYLVIPTSGASHRLGERLGRLPGCEVVPALNDDLLILLTESDGAEAERRLRSSIEELEDVRALLLTFGEVPSSAEPRS